MRRFIRPVYTEQRVLLFVPVINKGAWFAEAPGGGATPLIEGRMSRTVKRGLL